MKYYKHYNKIWAKIFVVVVALCGFILCSKTAYAADTTWQDDFSPEYTTEGENHYVKLMRYTGTASKLTIPAKAVKDGVEYTTYIDSYSGKEMWSGAPNLTDLSFESGIQLGTNLMDLFSKCSSLKTLNISNFDTSNVTNMSCMFYGCNNLTTLNVSNFDTSKVTDMANMFAECSKLTTLELRNFDTSNVTDMFNMFYNCSNISTVDVSTFNTSKVTGMGNMFGGCSSLTKLDLSSFNTSKVTEMGNMFYNCSSLTTLNLSSFNTKNVLGMASMFAGCSSLTTLNLSNFDTHNVTNLCGMFYGCSSLKTLDLSNFDTSQVINLGSLFSECSNLMTLNVSSFDTSKVINMAYMFAECSKLTTLDLSKFNTANVTSMRSMFEECSSLTMLNVSNFDTSKVTNMEDMFSGCSNLTELDISKFNTANVTTMAHLFRNCSTITTLNVSSFDTSKVKDMEGMFGSCSKVTALNVSKFNTSNVTNMVNMFSDCSTVTELDVSNFDTSNVPNMLNMFLGCSSLITLDLSSFNTSKVTDMRLMFCDCSSLKNLDLSSFECSNVSRTLDMLAGCSSLETIDTPRNMTQDVDLPGAFRDEDKNKYNSLPKQSYVSIHLTKVPAFIDGSTAEITVADQTYSGEEKRPDVTVKIEGERIDSEHYSVSYSNNIDVGTATVTVKFYDNYTGTATGSFNIKPLNANSSNAYIMVSDQLFTGEEIKPAVTVIVEETIVSPENYTVSYSDNINVGTATVKVALKGNYTGNITGTFEIELGIVDASSAQIIVSDQTYTGSELKPDITVKLGEETIDAKYYVVSYSDNINVGTAMVLVGFNTNYTGTASASFIINPLEMDSSNAKVLVSDQLYTGREIKPSVTVRHGEEIITPENYTISYSNNINVGTATVTVTFRDNYTGSVTGTFEIKQDIVDASSAQITVPDQTYTGETIVPPVTVKLGEETIAPQYYTLSFNDNINAGTATVTVVFKGNYSGTATGSFEINPLEVDTSSVDITVSDQTYTGTELEPVVEVKLEGEPLSQDKYTVSYNDNINAGTAKVTVIFKGNYTGTASKTFKINPIQVASSAVIITVSDQIYKGQPLEPPVNVKVGGETITAENYRVSYDNNFNAGTAKVTVTFKGNYRGTAAATFKIKEGNNGGNPSDGTTAEKKPAAGKVKSIKLKANKTKVKKGKKVTVKATVVYSGARNGGSKAVTWKVKGPGKISKKKATSCTITAKKKKGTITVTAISKQDKKVKKTIKIKVQ